MSFPVFPRATLRRQRVAAIFISSVWFGILVAAEDSDKKVTRLGFAFDPKVHDAAISSAFVGVEGENRGSDDVIHLPKYFVTENRVPFTQRDILTPEGRVQVANKRYISPVYRKTLGPLAAVLGLFMNPLGGWQPNDPEAMVLYEDAERKRRNTETKELMQHDALKE